MKRIVFYCMLIIILALNFSCQQQVSYETSEAGFKQFINDFETNLVDL